MTNMKMNMKRRRHAAPPPPPPATTGARLPAITKPTKHHSKKKKSKNKAKGAYKLKSGDVTVNHRLVAWRVVDKEHQVNSGKPSASEFLRCLIGVCLVCEEVYDDDGGGGGGEVEGDQGVNVDDEEDVRLVMECKDGDEGSLLSDDDVDDDVNDSLGFCKVGFVLECLDGEDWCVVTEI